MPELPEIETVARGLRARLPGKHLRAVELYRSSVFRGEELTQIEGAVVVGIQRAGKYLILELTNALINELPNIDGRGTPLGCAERPAYAHPKPQAAWGPRIRPAGDPQAPQPAPTPWPERHGGPDEGVSPHRLAGALAETLALAELRPPQRASALGTPARGQLAPAFGVPETPAPRGWALPTVQTARPPRSGQRWQLLFHLGMSGQLVLWTAGHARGAHTHAVFHFDSSLELHFRDPRRFGRIALERAPDGGPVTTGGDGLAAGLGVATGAEPLDISPDAFVALFYHRAAPIKNALLNQRLLRGLGNIYADESLFRAGIAPRARRLSRPRLLRLRQAIRTVLEEAIAAGGSSISDYLDSHGEPGWFHLQHRVYGRAGKPCRRCRTPIRRIVLAGRSAHFCPKCQKA